MIEDTWGTFYKHYGYIYLCIFPGVKSKIFFKSALEVIYN